MKKCSRCSKPSTLHITEIREGVVEELHFCESCAHEYLTSPQNQPSTDEADDLSSKIKAAAGDRDEGGAGQWGGPRGRGEEVMTGARSLEEGLCEK